MDHNWITIENPDGTVSHLRADYANEIRVGPGRRYATVAEWEAAHVRPWTEANDPKEKKP